MKITVLGSRGQIGLYLTEYLISKGHEIYEVDIVNGEEQDMTQIPNSDLEEKISNISNDEITRKNPQYEIIHTCYKRY